VRNVPAQAKKLILPFAVPAKDQIRPFTKGMEMAAIFYLAESDRKKGEGRVLKKPAEKLAFIAELCYPMWIVPWRGRILLFDGLNLTKHQLSYDVIPDIKTFHTDVEASSKSREAYGASLSQNTSYFQKFEGKEERTVEGLIVDLKFTEDLNKYLKEAEDAESLKTTMAFLSPSLEEPEVKACIEELSELRARVKEEIKTLEKNMKLLSKWTKEQVKALQTEMKKTMKQFDQQMEKIRPGVMKKIKKIQEKRDKNVTRISRKFDLKLRTLHKNRVKTEKTIERMESYCERYEADIKACRERGDEVGELQLNKKINETKKRIPELQKEILENDQEIVKVEDEKKIELARARMKPEDHIEEAMKSLRDIEAAKESRMRMEEQDLESLEKMTSSIIAHINAMVKAKEEALNAIDNVGAPTKRRKHALVYVPFYFVSYETKSTKRYVVYPPSILGSMGIKTKLKGVFGASKMKSFLQSRSQVIGDLLDRVVDLTQENPVFEKEITEAGIEANILRITELREDIKKGLAELLQETWISKDEFQYLSTLL
jgi:hypothetical protein